MAKIKVDVEELISHPKLRMFSLPWAEKTIVGHLAFERGKVPAHLEPYLIKKGECKGMKGFRIYKGKRLPAAAVCVAEKHKKGAK